ncbi:MAG: 4-alpha-glucanotransferase, partial [Paracoccaceae bacterium]
KAGRIEFHRWLQWVADKQLASTQSNLLHSGMPLGLYLDLAVGARRGGAESWCEADAIAQGVSVGAPPDHLSPAGQNWDLAAFAPHRLKGQKYAAYRRILRSCMRHAGVLRIDHVLGLNRSFWIPDDGSPGGYVSQPMEALSAIIRIEAERANTLIIGEDLGLVPEGFRARMRAQGFYGYSVVQYEKTKEGAFRQPEDYEPQILACFGTHDTPTLQGFRTGRDIEWWRTLGWISEKTAAKARIDRRAEVKGIIELGSRQDGYAGDHVSASDKDVSVAVHGALASSPSALVSVQLDDILFNTETQNLPGTIDQHPNWRRNYATTPEGLSENAHLNAISGWMRDAGRASTDDTEEEVGK